MKKETRSIKRMKQEAKRIKKEENLKHSDALDLVAKKYGFDNWNVLSEELSRD